MKKIIVITVLALFLAIFPVMALTDWDFTANSNTIINAVTLNIDGSASTTNLTIVNDSKAESLSFSDGTLTITDAATSTFQIYAAYSSIEMIKIASTSYTSCTANDSTGATPVTIASSTVDGTIFTVSLVTHTY